jgi:signal transduction histidine kinase
MRVRDEALLEALDAAEAANAAKTQFLANTSHELRTPLNAIIGYAEIIEEDAIDHREEGIARDAQRISEAGKRLLSLINDILDMSKIEAGKLHVCADEFDLGALMREAVANVAPQARANKVRLHTEIDPNLAPMFTDGMRLRQCLLNLLANAVKFTSGGLVVARARAQVGGFVRIEIIDTGIGMTNEEVARLFQPFVQASAKTTQRFGGTGLGLAITKRLANMLGGDISVTSAPGLGSCFALVIPIELEESAEARAA